MPSADARERRHEDGLASLLTAWRRIMFHRHRKDCIPCRGLWSNNSCCSFNINDTGDFPTNAYIVRIFAKYDTYSESITLNQSFKLDIT